MKLLKTKLMNTNGDILINLAFVTCVIKDDRYSTVYFSGEEDGVKVMTSIEEFEKAFLSDKIIIK